MAEPEYITVEEAAEILQVTTRQAHRYGERGRIQTRKAGRRVMFNRTDVETLADDLGVLTSPRPNAPRTDLVPAGDMLDYIRERDQRLDELQGQLVSAAAELGRLKAENDQLRHQLTTRRPWWSRLFGK